MTPKFVWFEYVSGDAAKAQGFFGELFNWSTKQVPMPQGDYTMIAAGDRTIGGYLAPPAGVPPQAHWLSHLGVASAKATAAKVTALGGSVAMEPFKVGEFGTMAVVRDPHGGVFALWQPSTSEPQPQPTTGTFCWNELFSAEPEKSVAFYQGVGGFELQQMAMADGHAYHLLASEGIPRAGIMQQMMKGQPHAWLPYVQVASTDATTAKAKRLGATELVPPTDIPGVGRFAIFADPQGAPLGVLQPSAS
jgi:uncharacterized protein